jgi:hypothetical protein
VSEKVRNDQIDELAEKHGVVLRMEPAEVYDPAVIAFAIGIGSRVGQHFLVYDRELVVEQAVEHEGMDYETAVEWHEFNTFDAYLGAGTPVFV